ncbi:conserved Plasmodium protein, unknown function [Babesia microti strain RI]|uniref:Uncharacterized protein n=1 Tax=Babesia microti (strain RI) TaxID=1133968 RepID=A0A1N6LWF2_BABMR|nr:conserved Plasmodium protein, unknown function [Babesia microti strain RI]SIO73205.1 conserved Plasmodium protein, unknown function [Babesia microti strain RI]|eukprot:XP_021337313.1 conserved Plasmodium protein, unknown function [Babesia microti strain RI]
MAKGLRAKTLRRYRAAKRHIIDEKLESRRSMTLYDKMIRLCRGEQVDYIPAPNMFVHPELPTSEIPQRIPQHPIDLRSEAVPAAGFAFKGNRKKFTREDLRESSILRSSIGYRCYDHNKNISPQVDIMNDIDVDDSTAIITSSERSGFRKKFKGNTIAVKKFNKSMRKKH